MSFLGEPNPVEQALSPNLGILPLKDRVLLPSSAMKLVLTHTRDVALVDSALASGNVASGTLFVGVVPLRREPGLDAETAAQAMNSDLPHDAVDVRERLHAVGSTWRRCDVGGMGARGRTAAAFVVAASRSGAAASSTPCASRASPARRSSSIAASIIFCNHGSSPPSPSRVSLAPRRVLSRRRRPLATPTRRRRKATAEDADVDVVARQRAAAPVAGAIGFVSFRSLSFRLTR